MSRPNPEEFDMANHVLLAHLLPIWTCNAFGTPERGNHKRLNEEEKSFLAPQSQFGLLWILIFALLVGVGIITLFYLIFFLYRRVCSRRADEKKRRQYIRTRISELQRDQAESGDLFYSLTKPRQSSIRFSDSDTFWDPTSTKGVVRIRSLADFAERKERWSSQDESLQMDKIDFSKMTKSFENTSWQFLQEYLREKREHFEARELADLYTFHERPAPQDEIKDRDSTVRNSTTDSSPRDVPQPSRSIEARIHSNASPQDRTDHKHSIASSKNRDDNIHSTASSKNRDDNIHSIASSKNSDDDIQPIASSKNTEGDIQAIASSKNIDDDMQSFTCSIDSYSTTASDGRYVNAFSVTASLGEIPRILQDLKK